MNSRRIRTATSLAALALATLASAPALAQSRQVTTPNVTTADGEVAVTLNGITFRNRGLVGTGRLDANTRDFAGETLGSFSGMALDLTQWRRNPDGSYTGLMYTLPDRGPNDVGPFVGTTNYRNRVHTSALAFRPYASLATLPQSTASQNQLTISPTGGLFLTDSTGANFTGRDAGSSVTTRNGVLYPLVASGEGAGRISLDSEAIAFRPDGSFYVSDEYAANIYYFDATGRQLGALNTVNALLPKTAGGVVSFDGGSAPATGRRNNQGLESLAITPDNKRLVTILQSATIQDTSGSSQQTRNNTRILVYDISGGAIPNANPIGHYVLQLPVFNQNGSGGAPDRTAAQSEMLALNDTQFLVLSRDGIGRGSNPTNSTTPVFKSVLLVDTAGATNLAGAAYESGTTPVATSGTLAAGIVPVRQFELVNLLNATQLNRFGMNLNTRPSNATSLSEKWEAMALAPVLEDSAPQDFFLFIGNDNDFQAGNGFINGQSYNGSLSGTGGTGNNDSVMLVYRLTLPTYVDPQALAALNVTSPEVLYGTRVALNDMAVGATQPAMRVLNAQRSLGADPDRKTNLWLEGDSTVSGLGGRALGESEIDHRGVTGGIDSALGTFGRLGIFAGLRDLEGNLGAADPFKATVWTLGAYAMAEMPAGFYLEGSAAWFGDIDIERVTRSSAYGQQASGRTAGEGWAASGEAGWQVPFGMLTVTPFAALDYSDLELSGYAESGASVSNLTFPDRAFRKLTASLGGEVSTQLGVVRPALRGGYSFEDERGDDAASVRLTSAQHAMGTVLLPLADTERNSAFAELRIAAREGPLAAYASGRGRWGKGEDDLRASITLSYGF